jgi:glycerol-3-phosphate dehydrogenase
MLYDLFIIGGGINGTAIAREAALGGWSVMLAERDDLAGHTSSASSKLIHGGLRYLEQYEFKLVREALLERTLLMRAAPHLIEPMQFVLPQAQSSRPWIMVRAGLVLYDLLAGRSPLPWARGLRRSDTAFQSPLQRPGSGFVYSDCKVDDARLTILCAVDAAQHGADIATRTAMASARREGDLWAITLSDGRTIRARAIANAAGPWVSEAIARTGINSAHGIRLIKGSHIVVPQLYEGDHAYLLQQPDKRVVFAVPYHHGTTMVGTTDIAVDAPEDAQIDDVEIAYLCDAANLYFKRTISPADIVNTWSGVRPLYNDGASAAQEVTRDYVLEMDDSGAPILSIFGGKITTARHLAEEAVGKIAKTLGKAHAPATRDKKLPGGDIGQSLADFTRDSIARWPWLGPKRTARMAGSYGSLLPDVIGDADGETAMGTDFGGGLTAREVDWLVTSEWARSADDILWRRTKLGLATGEETVRALTLYLSSRQDAKTPRVASEK